MTPHELVSIARECRTNAHAPYSRFRAGAAVLTDGGDVVPGVIVENVSLGLAMCAERVALFSTVARGASPRALALVAPRTGSDLTWPCGACRQVLWEFADGDLVVLVDGPEGTVETTLGELLPKGFRWAP